uniref:Pecanex-like protein n=1 Tax=Anisakis simplex TaxID=6269 RepID=A0A0M3JAB1_ANISI
LTSGDRVPSLGEIQQLEDRDLLDIFGPASNLAIVPTVERPPPNFSQFQSTPQTQRQITTSRSIDALPEFVSSSTRSRPPGFMNFNGNTGRRESIPILRNRAFEEPPRLSNNLYRPSDVVPVWAYEAGSNLGELASTGAEAFISGAHGFGRAFGVDTYQLSSDLLKVGSTFLGRKR